jgi:hypothetical protein
MGLPMTAVADTGHCPTGARATAVNGVSSGGPVKANAATSDRWLGAIILA